MFILLSKICLSFGLGTQKKNVQFFLLCDTYDEDKMRILN